MAFGDLFPDFLTRMFSPGGGGSGLDQPFGYSGMTPDQIRLINQQGFAPRPDMVLPTGSTLQQPTGYSGLTPAEAMSVNDLGYYSKNLGASDSGSSDSLFSKLAKGLGSQQGQDAIKKLGELGDPGKPLGTPPAAAPRAPFGGASLSPYAYLTRFNSPLDPKLALRRFMYGGSLYG